MEADQIGHKVAKIGFEWPSVAGVVEKLKEEAAELAEAQARGNQEHIEHEIGDLLFNVVNLARYLKVDPEQALRKTNARFRQRFAHVEQEIVRSGGTLEASSLEEMDALWQQAKTAEHQ
jgi:uncharacterized protein YabN with tetrapyrrole methylase and pyrophosphatase domain